MQQSRPPELRMYIPKKQPPTFKLVSMTLTSISTLHPHQITPSPNRDLTLPPPLPPSQPHPHPIATPRLKQKLLTPSISKTKQPARRPSPQRTTRQPLLLSLNTPDLPPLRCLLAPLLSPTLTLSTLPTRSTLLLATPLTPLHLTAKRRISIDLPLTTPPPQRSGTRQRPSSSTSPSRRPLLRVGACASSSSSSDLFALEPQLRLQTRGSPPRRRRRRASSPGLDGGARPGG